VLETSLNCSRHRQRSANALQWRLWGLWSGQNTNLYKSRLYAKWALPGSPAQSNSSRKPCSPRRTRVYGIVTTRLFMAAHRVHRYTNEGKNSWRSTARSLGRWSSFPPPPNSRSSFSPR
jgi:hypothetical protein